MKVKLLFCAAALFAAENSSAEVLYTFDDPGGGNQGSIAPFVADMDATSLLWSSVNGGSMELSFGSGVKSKVAKLNLRGDPALSAEYDQALANGGTLSFTIIVRSDDILGTTAPFNTPPQWFDSTYIGASGIWDQQFGSSEGLISLSGAAGFPPGSVQTFNISYPIVADTVASNDRVAQFNAAAKFHEIYLGMNSGCNNCPAPVYAGGKYYIDNFRIAANAAPVAVAVPTLSISKASRGMHLLSAVLAQWQRQGLRTTGENHSWVGAGGPVEYKLTFADFPKVNNMYAVMTLAPGTGVTGTVPDWSEPVAIQVAMVSNASGGGTGYVAYKDHVRESNGLAGHEYWVPDDGTGQGGMLASVNTARMNGTWTLRFNSNTSLTFISPDGTSSQATLLPATAAKFANPVAVWFSTLPGDPANIGLDTIVGGIHITGVPNPINVNFDGPEFPPQLQVSAILPEAVYYASRPAYWVEWTLPAVSGFTFQQNPSPGNPALWTPATVHTAFNVPGGTTRRALVMPDPPVEKMFFRLYKP